MRIVYAQMEASSEDEYQKCRFCIFLQCYFETDDYTGTAVFCSVSLFYCGLLAIMCQKETCIVEQP